jgi:flavin-binding protein dodecin
MSHPYQIIEVVGSSPNSIQEAVRTAVDNATVSGESWFEVREVRGRIEGGQVAEFQVRVAVAASRAQPPAAAS